MADFSPLNENLRQSINERMRAAEAPESDFDKAKASGQLKEFTPNVVPFDASFQGDAIQKMANRKILGGNLNDLRALEKASYIPKTFNKRLGALNQGISVYKFDLARKQAINELQEKRAAQRAQVMGSLMGIVGGIGGFAIGGPPGGMAGSQIGSQAATAGQGAK